MVALGFCFERDYNRNTICFFLNHLKFIDILMPYIFFLRFTSLFVLYIFSYKTKKCYRNICKLQTSSTYRAVSGIWGGGRMASSSPSKAVTGKPPKPTRTGLEQIPYCKHGRCGGTLLKRRHRRFLGWRLVLDNGGIYREVESMKKSLEPPCRTRPISDLSIDELP